MKKFLDALTHGVPRIVEGELLADDQISDAAFQIADNFVDHVLSLSNLRESEKQVIKSKLYSDESR